MNDATAGDGRPDHDAPDYDAMERDIRRSRESIGVSLSEIRRRLSLSHLKEQTMNRTVNRRNTGTHTGNTSSSSSGSSSMGDMVRGNPIPLAMVGIGLGWLLLSRTGYDRRIANSSAVRSIGDHAGSTARYARDTFYGAGESVRDAASSAYGRVTGGSDDQHQGAGSGGTVSGGGAPIRSADMDRSGGRSMGRRVQSATSGVWDMVEEHPLVAGVMGVALGAAIGASIPSSSYENALVGEYSDQITRQAKDMAHDALDRGTRAARAAADAAREQVVNAADDARERVAAAASEVKSATKDELNRPT